MIDVGFKYVDMIYQYYFRKTIVQQFHENHDFKKTILYYDLVPCRFFVLRSYQKKEMISLNNKKATIRNYYIN